MPNEAEKAHWNDHDWARAWPKRERLTSSVTPLLLDALDLRPGERVLDIGCGGGGATIAAASRVEPGGAVVGADISLPLLELAGQRAAGMQLVSFCQADLQVDTVAPEPFDVAMSQFGVMFFDQPAAAFANIRSHLRPGGRLGFVCWQEVEHNPWFVGPALSGLVTPPPPPGPGKSAPGPFTLGSRDLLVAILTEAGFADVGIDRRHHDVDVPTSAVIDDAQLRFMGVAEPAVDEARRRVYAYMERFAAGEGTYRFPLAFQVVTAAAPGRPH